MIRLELYKLDGRPLKEYRAVKQHGTRVVSVDTHAYTAGCMDTMEALCKRAGLRVRGLTRSFNERFIATMEPTHVVVTDGQFIDCFLRCDHLQIS